MTVGRLLFLVWVSLTSFPVFTVATSQPLVELPNLWWALLTDINES